MAIIKRPLIIFVLALPTLLAERPGLVRIQVLPELFAKRNAK
jgi:hypothetical protein